MRIVFFGYRDWSIDIFTQIDIKEKYLFNHGDYEILYSIKPELVFFIGWSEIVPNKIVRDFKCVCLHPSPLPKYRGGSPIQHQILCGETDSAVTYFIMDEGLDTGDILYQSKFSLDGSLSDIFNRIIEVGVDGLKYIIKNFENLESIKIKQDNSNSSTYKRRTSSESEITLDEIINNDPIYLYNKIRCLNSPYPNAYLKCKDGKKLFLLDCRYES